MSGMKGTAAGAIGLPRNSRSSSQRMGEKDILVLRGPDGKVGSVGSGCIVGGTGRRQLKWKAELVERLNRRSG